MEGGLVYCTDEVWSNAVKILDGQKLKSFITSKIDEMDEDDARSIVADYGILDDESLVLKTTGCWLIRDRGAMRKYYEEWKRVPENVRYITNLAKKLGLKYVMKRSWIVRGKLEIRTATISDPDRFELFKIMGSRIYMFNRGAEKFRSCIASKGESVEAFVECFNESFNLSDLDKIESPLTSIEDFERLDYSDKVDICKQLKYIHELRGCLKTGKDRKKCIDELRNKYGMRATLHHLSENIDVNDDVIKDVWRACTTKYLVS